MIKRFLNSQSKNITFAAILVGSSAALSRILGLFRDRLLAGGFGAGEELDIYFAAFRIPDFVHAMFIMGGLSMVFVPMLAHYFRKGEEEAWEFTNNLLNVFFVMLIVVCGLLALITPWIIHLIIPGFSPEQKEMTVVLARIMFLSPIFFALSSVFSGVLQYFNRFLSYALAPIFYNLGIIFGILFLVPRFGLVGLAYGVVIGAFFHWILQLPAARMSGYRYIPSFNFRAPGLIRVFKLMLPRTIGSAAQQINLIVITAIASTLAVGSIAIFNFADNLRFFPVSIIGVSFSLAAFPVLSRAWADGDRAVFRNTFSSTFRQIMLLVFPVSLLLFLLRAQIVRLVLGTGQFGWSDTRLTAACLGVFCIGVLANTFIPFLARTFYSFHDTRTPVAIGLGTVGINILLSLAFVRLLAFPNVFRDTLVSLLKLQGLPNIEVVGLPLALSLATLFQFGFLLFFLRKKIGTLQLEKMGEAFKRVVIASFVMLVAVYAVCQVVAGFVDIDTVLGLFLQTMSALVVGFSVYIFVCYLLKSPELRVFKTSVFEQFSKGD